MNNAQIRQQLRQQRNRLNDDAQASHQRGVLKHLDQSGLLKPFTHFAIYLQNDGELQTDLIIDHLWQINKCVHLPVLHPQQSNQLLFIHYSSSTPLIANRFGIKEPASTKHSISVSALDIIFLPLVAFNNEGHRLGMGGGYYDRTLASVNLKQSSRTLFIGIAHEFQCNENFITHDLDIPMDGIITEKKVRFISKALKTAVAN